MVPLFILLWLFLGRSSADLSVNAELALSLVESSLDLGWIYSNIIARSTKSNIVVNQSNGVPITAEVQQILWYTSWDADESLINMFSAFSDESILQYGTSDGVNISYGISTSEIACTESGFSSNAYLGNCLRFYRTDKSDGSATLLTSEEGYYNPMAQSWYQVGNKSKVWSDPYVTSSGAVVLDALQPMYLRDKSFVGVCGASLALTTLEAKLRSAVNGSSDLIFIIEADSHVLVAASEAGIAAEFSTGSTNIGFATSVSNSNITSYLGSAWDSSEPRVFTAMSALNATNFRQSGNDSVIYAGGSFHSATSYSDSYGLDWIIIVSQVTNCDPGYGLNRITAACEVCDVNYYSDGGTSECTQCDEDYYTLDNSTANVGCRSCPEDAYCPGGSDLPYNLEGYWCEYHGSPYLRKKMLECVVHAGKSCRPTYRRVNTFEWERVCDSPPCCAHGYDDNSRACSKPDDGFMFVGSFPISCGENYNVVTVGSYALLILLVYLVTVAADKYDTLNLFLISLQNMALIYSFEFEWPKRSYLILDAVFSVALIDFGSTIFPKCAIEGWEWENGMLLSVFIPLILVPCSLGVHHLRGKIDYARAVGLGMMFLDISYAGVVYYALQALACEQDVSGKYYVHESPNTECYTSEYWRKTGGIAIFSLVVIGVGFPLYSLKVVLKKLNKEDPSEEDFLTHGYAISTFRHKRRYWNTLTIFRSFLLSAISANLWMESSLQGAACILVELAYLLVLLRTQPFAPRYLTLFQAGLTTVEVTVTICGYLYDAGTYVGVVEITMVLILIIVFVFAGLIVVFNELFEDLLRTESELLIDVAKKQAIAAAESQRIIEEILHGEVTPEVSTIIIHMQQICRRNLAKTGFYEKALKAKKKKRSKNFIVKGVKALINIIKNSCRKLWKEIEMIKSARQRKRQRKTMRKSVKIMKAEALQDQHAEAAESKECNPQTIMKIESAYRGNFEDLPQLKDTDKPTGGKRKKRLIKFGRNKIRYYSRSDNLGEDGDDPTMVIKFDEDETVVNEAADAEALQSLLGVLDARLFSRWVQEPNRAIEELDECVQIARTLRPFLEDTHALSIYGHDTFWQDLVTKFPVLIDWLLDMLCSASKDADDFEEARDAVFQIFDKIRIFVKQSKSKHSGNLADGIIATARAPVFYYLLTEALQEDLDMMNIFLMQMNIDHQHNYLSSLTGLKNPNDSEDSNRDKLSSMFKNALKKKDIQDSTGSLLIARTISDSQKAKVENEKKLEEMRAAHQATKAKRRRQSGSSLKKNHQQAVEGVAGIGHNGVVYSKEHGEAVKKIQGFIRQVASRGRLKRVTRFLIATSRGDMELADKIRRGMMSNNEYQHFLLESESAKKIQKVWRGVTSRQAVSHIKVTKVQSVKHLPKEPKGAPHSSLGKKAQLDLNKKLNSKTSSKTLTAKLTKISSKGLSKLRSNKTSEVPTAPWTSPPEIELQTSPPPPASPKSSPLKTSAKANALNSLGRQGFTPSFKFTPVTKPPTNVVNKEFSEYSELSRSKLGLGTSV